MTRPHESRRARPVRPTSEVRTLNAAERFKDYCDLIQRAEAFWTPIHRAMTDKVDFLIGGKHYKDQYGDDDFSSEAIRWVGEQSFDAWRHEVGVVHDGNTSINARPLDSGDDPDLAEQAVALIESDITNPAKEFEDVMEDVVGCASAAGLAYATIDWLPDEGRWGELSPRFLDCRDVLRDPSVKSVHSLRCRFLIIRERLSKSEAMARCGKKGGMWRASVVARMQPHADVEEQRTGEVSPLVQPSKPADKDLWTDDEQITFYYVWERKPKDAKRAPRPETYTDLPEGERYLACTMDGCGHRSKTQDEAGHELPESADCPECGGYMDLIVAREDEDTLLAYPKGKLTIVAPFAGVDKPAYEGDWPIPFRSYPVMELVRFRHPFKALGPSLADLHQWNQIATDMVMRLALERMVQSAPFWLLPRTGLSDAAGNEWQNTDENGWTAFYDGDSMPQLDMKEGAGLPAQWSSVYQAANASLSAHMGRADFQMAPGQTRDIPASSVAQQIQQEEIPVAHYKRRYQRAKGIYIGLWYDGVRACYPEERIMRMRGPDGMDAVMALKASDMPNYDFHLTDTPELTALDEQKQKAVEYLRQLIVAEPPGVVDAVAAAMKFPPSVVRKMRNAYQQAAQEQQDALDEQKRQADALAASQGQVVPNGGPPAQGPPAPQQGMDSAAMVDELLASMGPQ